MFMTAAQYNLVSLTEGIIDNNFMSLYTHPNIYMLRYRTRGLQAPPLK